MELKFGHLTFKTENDKITLNGLPFVEVQIAGRNKNSHMGTKCVRCSESETLRYAEHVKNGNTLQIVQQNEQIKVTTTFADFVDSSAFSAQTAVECLCDQVVLEQVSSFVLGLGVPDSATRDVFLTEFLQSHHGECQTRAQSLFDMGLYDVTFAGQNKVGHLNVGSWSTKEALPQAILQHGNSFLMFQIESNNSWQYEISDCEKKLYLYLGGANVDFGGWSKILRRGETYVASKVALCDGNSIDEVIGKMTKYRRHIVGKCAADDDMPVIFNEYMHLSWDSPSEEKVRLYAPTVAAVGCEIYVIDCGWHNEEDGDKVYPFVGQWKESGKRFPYGVRATTDYIRSLGMKAGLWIEPEIVGIDCKEMLEYYDESCFLHRFGKRICVQNRYFLNFSNEKVNKYLTFALKRMVKDYGADYVKLDYNQDMGVGCDEGESFGEGLERNAKAYLRWIDSLREMFPNVVFETCSSGGMRMDWETLSHFSIVSTSDQTDYKKYPYIAANVLSAALPEQAAVWSYPVGSPVGPNGNFAPTEKWVEQNISADQVVFNMVNCLLGRIHLASHLELLSPEKLALVKEGVEYYKKIASAKKNALPVFPRGFANFGDDVVASGFYSENKVYLAVWNIDSDAATIPLNFRVKYAKIVYPQKTDAELIHTENSLKVIFPRKLQAVFAEVEIEK